MHPGKFRKPIDHVRDSETLEVMYLESGIHSIHSQPYGKAVQRICPIRGMDQ